MDDYLAEHGPEPSNEERAIEMLRFLSEYNHLQFAYEMYVSLKGKLAAKADPEVVASLPRTISENLDSESQCTICLNYFGKKDPNPNAEVMIMPCNHKFHSSCLMKWLDIAAACPLCRKDLPSKDKFMDELKKKIEREQKRQADIDELHDSMYM